MTSRECARAYAEASGDWSEYVKKWRGDMTDLQEPAAWLCRPYEATKWTAVMTPPTDERRRFMEFVPLYRNAGKLSQAQITAAIDAMKDCGLPYMPRQRREIIVQIVAKSFGLEIE